MSTKEKIINESISKRFERHEENLQNLFEKVNHIEVAQSEYKKRLHDLENGRSRNENEHFELQHVKNFICH
jgi:hypothetical protein